MTMQEQAKLKHQQKIRAQINEIDAEIAKLRQQAEAMEADSKLRAEQEIDKLDVERERLEDKLQALEQAGTDKWQELQTGVDAAVNGLQNAVSQATSSFKQTNW